MLVGVVGPAGAGTASLVEILVEHHGFRLIRTEDVIRSTRNARAIDALGGGDAAAGPAAKRRRTPAAPAPEDTAKSARVDRAAHFGRHVAAVEALRADAGSTAFAAAVWSLFMENWRGDAVIEWAMDSVPDVRHLRQRSLFFLYGITASTLHRYQRQRVRARHRRRFRAHTSPQAQGAGAAPSLEAFVAREASAFKTLHAAMQMCDDVIVNDGAAHDLARALVLRTERGLAHRRPRPAWDTYFMRLAFLAAKRSNCMKRRVGAIVVRDNRVVSTGYNGTPRSLRNCMEGGCPRCNSNAATGAGLDQCLCLHAEENAIMEAGTERARGCTIYSTSFPCLQCTKRIIQVGIRRVVFAEAYATDTQAGALLREARVEVARATDEVVAYRWVDLAERDPTAAAVPDTVGKFLDAPSPAEPTAAAAAALPVGAGDGGGNTPPAGQ